MGPVFRAYEPERDRLVAVKLFRLDILPQRVHQLAAELDTLIGARLSHPVLALPIAAGIAGVSSYLGQEFVAADSLDMVVREFGPTPAADALRMATDLAGALDAAAAADVVHGALHPRDVLVSGDVTRLTGIGIARALEHTGVAAHLRRPYTAPERAAGAAWDRRADVFSLAVVVHEMIWGRRLAGPGDHAAQMLTEVAGGDLSALRRVFACALAEAPEERFPTSLAFVESLREAFPKIAAPAGAKNSSRSGGGSSRLDPAPRLPLDEPVPLQRATADDEPLITPAAAAAPLLLDPDLRRAEDPFYAVADQSFAVADPALGPDADPADLVIDSQIDRSPAVVDDDRPEPVVRVTPEAPPRQEAPLEPVVTTKELEFDVMRDEAIERVPSTSLVPLVLAVLLGVAIGFAFGYALGYRAQPGQLAEAIGAVPTAGRSAPAVSAPPAGAREFTETAMQDLPLPSPPPPAITASASVPDGRLMVRSAPAGARVQLDGKDIGRTPLAADHLARGTHNIRLTRDGYAPLERRIALTPDRPTASMTLKLSQIRAAAPKTTAAAKPVIPAAAVVASPGLVPLGVDSRPLGANVLVDGKLIGTTPLSVNVTAGEHVVQLERDGYRRWSSPVRVVAGERNRVAASLDR